MSSEFEGANQVNIPHCPPSQFDFDAKTDEDMFLMLAPPCFVSKFNTENNEDNLWKESLVRKRLRREMYEPLPEKLKNMIVPRYVFDKDHGSSYGDGTEDDYTSYDHIFLLSSGEYNWLHFQDLNRGGHGLLPVPFDEDPFQVPFWARNTDTEEREYARAVEVAQPAQQASYGFYSNQQVSFVSFNKGMGCWVCPAFWIKHPGIEV